jgi:hypothetical protein
MRIIRKTDFYKVTEFGRPSTLKLRALLGSILDHDDYVRPSAHFGRYQACQRLWTCTCNFAKITPVKKGPFKFSDKTFGAMELF